MTWLYTGMDRPEVRGSVVGSPLFRDRRLCMITIGIDPHKSSRTAVAVDSTGEPMAAIRMAVTATTGMPVAEVATSCPQRR
jgi:hypothetical protein